jgi:hypothetical protein
MRFDAAKAQVTPLKDFSPPAPTSAPAGEKK